MTAMLALLAVLIPAGLHAAQGRAVLVHGFTMPAAGEAVATITAGCGRCDWGEAGREAVALRVLVDGRYSQHLLLVRGETPAPYRIMLGSLGAGGHRLTIERDTALSARDAGPLRIVSVEVATFAAGTAEHTWLSQAPFIYARAGTVERFSDVPMLMWVERAPAPGRGFRYSVIFTHEDGGTPTDRLMATWGRTTDIEFIFGIEDAGDGAIREEYQGRNHEILPFRGTREGTHPMLWVSTDNNMVSDSGADGVRFAPAPEMVTLEQVSREVVMDQRPWTYAVMAAELRREGRIDPDAQPGSAKVPDVRQFVYIEGCGDVDRATLAFDVAVEAGAQPAVWHASDRGDVRFRIARGGCFRAAVPVPHGTTPDLLRGVRIRAYTRPRRDGEPVMPAGTGRVTLQRLNTVFMLDDRYQPRVSALKWTGALEVRGESAPIVIPFSASAFRAP
jgi:hypothetical protein